jgi:carboxyl-terminal processing protease
LVFGLCLGVAWDSAAHGQGTAGVAGSRSSAASAAAPSDSEIESALQRALELERQRQWSQAIEVYEDALRKWPSRTEFRHRQRLCEAHYKLGRRYQDASFRTILLRMAREQALLLYDELLERIEEHYVEAVGPEPLVRRGLDNLEVALRDPWFIETNQIDVPPDRVKWLRDQYRLRRERLSISDRQMARAEVEVCCQLARQAIGVSSAPIILEFVYGACEALDPYSCYLTRDRLDDLYSMIDGNFVGLGVELKAAPQGLRLVGVIRGGPAWEAGLRAGDHITGIGTKSVQGLGLDEAANMLQGEEGSQVTITVAKSKGTSQTLTLVRRPVEVASVAQSAIIDPTTGLGYLQLAAFQKNTVEEVRQAVLDLQKQGMRYLVIDLRGNPGGLLNSAVEIADLFLDQGVIVSTRGRAANQSSIFRAQPGVVTRFPIVVLVDHDSASASEILAGALQENRRAWVFGERSYGKGSVQSIFPLRTASAGLKLTTAKFYSPRNRAYSEEGVVPDLNASVRAKPAASGGDLENFEMGNPEHDPVLDQAIRLVQRQLSTASSGRGTR